MCASDADPLEISFSAADLVKLFAATFLPLCDELEAGGVIDRGRLANAMELYVAPGETGPSAAMVAALQTVLRRPRPDVALPLFSEKTKTELRLVLGGRHAVEIGEG